MPGKLPANHPPMPGQEAPKGPVAGTIHLAPELKGDVKVGSVLYVIVRRDAGAGRQGMLLAAKKVPVTGAAMFPYAYEVTEKDLMIDGTTMEGALRVSARADQDIDAISKTPGDLTGAMDRPVPAGSSGADFALDAKIP